jgi:hypothetical protein
MRNWTFLIVSITAALAVCSASPFGGSTRPVPGTRQAATKAAPRLRLVSKSLHDTYLSYLPDTTDDWFNALKDKDLIFYNESAMPMAYQNGGGIHDPFYNISASKPAEPYGNGNFEFPWGKPAGLRLSKNSRSFKFVYIPPDQSIWYWWVQQGGETVYKWQYPQGTVFGEVLLVADPKGYEYAFEVRTRLRGEEEWKVNVYRPFGTPAELANRVKELVPDWENDPALVKLVDGVPADDDGNFHLYNPHPKVIFNRVALTQTLPPIDHGLVRRLLTETKFRSVLGLEWSRGKDGVDCHAPTTEASFHIVPKGYEGHYLEVSTKKCMTCHDSTGKHVTEFQMNRDWYGRVRGSDGIFSFHIFDPGCISGNGFNVQVRFRQDLVDAGLLRHWE